MPECHEPVDKMPEWSTVVQKIYDACKATFTRNGGSFSAQGLLRVRSVQDPSVEPQDKEREWDRSDPMYSTMVKELAGSVVTTQERKGVSEDSYMRRPLPKFRQRVNIGFDEDPSVPPGTLNVGHIRQVFLSYQGLAEGEKPMNVEDLAKKYNVDAVLLEKVLRFHALLNKKGESKSVKEDSQGAARLE